MEVIIRQPGDLKEQKKRALGRVVSSSCKIFSESQTNFQNVLILKTFSDSPKY